MGTLPRVMTWNTRVPNPAVNSATLGFRPVSKGNQHQGAKGHKKHLSPQEAVFNPEVVICG